MKLGQTIVQIRKEHGLTQEDLAKEFSVTRQTVSNWENEKSYPDLFTLVKISDTYHYSLDRMLKEDIDMTEAMNSSIRLGNEAKNNGKRNLCIGAAGCIFCLLMAVMSIVGSSGALTVILWMVAMLINVLSIINGIKIARQPRKTLSADDAVMAKQLMDRGMKTEAIKLVRKSTGLGLAEAKDLLDTLRN